MVHPDSHEGSIFQDFRVAMLVYQPSSNNVYKMDDWQDSFVRFQEYANSGIPKYPKMSKNV